MSLRMISLARALGLLCRWCSTASSGGTQATKLHVVMQGTDLLGQLLLSYPVSDLLREDLHNELLPMVRSVKAESIDDTLVAFHIFARRVRNHVIESKR